MLMMMRRKVTELRYSPYPTETMARRGGGGRRGGDDGTRVDYDDKEEIEFTVTKDIQVMPDFESMGLRQELLRGIYDYGKFVRSKMYTVEEMESMIYIESIHSPGLVFIIHHHSSPLFLSKSINAHTMLTFTGFEKPSAIQQRAVLPIIKGHDVIAQSQSGTGKTAVFSMSILQRLDTTSNDTQALVLSPTRELAEQTQKVCNGCEAYGDRWINDASSSSSRGCRC